MNYLKKKLNFLKEKTSSLNIFSGEFYQMLKVKWMSVLIQNLPENRVKQITEIRFSKVHDNFGTKQDIIITRKNNCKLFNLFIYM